MNADPAPTYHQPQSPVGAVPVREATFGRQVLRAPLPVLAVFGASRCDASRALRPLLGELATQHAGRLLVATIGVERAADLAELYGVVATPTLLAFHYGAVLTRAVGFLPAPLLHLLADQIASETLPPEPLWSPLEATYEDLVLLPLLTSLGLTYARQVTGAALGRGRVDVLAYDGGAPLTLFENKRNLLSEAAVRQAAQQAHRYAVALALSSFVVAAPPGLWVYAREIGATSPIRRVSALELAQQPDDALALLRGLGR